MKEKIDFVILWVDGNDENWLSEKRKYLPKLENEDNNNNNRFRDWENLQYWFRAVEENAPWVNNIYFITWGHIPSWLDENHPKIKIIKHQDYIPKEFLPTYNSNTIELHLHRIESLSENFVLFNDDMFVMEKTKPEEFFKNNLPVEYYSEIVMSSKKPNYIYAHTLLNNISILNKYFNKKNVYKKNIFKYFNLKYGVKGNLSTLFLSMFNSFSMITNQHLPVPLKKSVLKELWEKEPEALVQSSKNRFRDLSDISQYLIRYFQLASGKFYPRKHSYGKGFNLQDDNSHIIKELKKGKYKIVCFNDTLMVNDFQKSKRSLNTYLENKFPKKSKYEL